ncbi:hypothetical protein J1614_007843 [Plenodomus biglobosus]|nr:hypothetical protein J1614_007843 [Plenodomus biglobosus]
MNRLSPLFATLATTVVCLNRRRNVTSSGNIGNASWFGASGYLGTGQALSKSLGISHSHLDHDVVAKNLASPKATASQLAGRQVTPKTVLTASFRHDMLYDNSCTKGRIIF